MNIYEDNHTCVFLDRAEDVDGQSVAHFYIPIIPRTAGDGVDVWPAFTGSRTSLDQIFKN